MHKKQGSEVLWRTFYTIIKVTGLLPCDYKKSAKSRFPTFHYSNVGNLYNVFLVIFILLIELYLFYVVPNWKILHSSPLVTTTNAVRVASGLASFIVTVPTAIWNQQSFVNILNDIVRFDRQIQVKQNGKFFVRIILSYFILILLIFICNYFVARQTDVTIVVLLAYHICFVVTSCYVMQYAMIVKVLDIRFQTINENLQQISNKNFVLSDICSDFKVKLTLDPDIMKLRILHEEMIKVAERVNDYFSFPILIIMMVTLYNFSSNIYILYVFIHEKRYSLNCIIVFMWTFYKIVPVLMLTKFVGHVLKEVNILLQIFL